MHTAHPENGFRRSSRVRTVVVPEIGALPKEEDIRKLQENKSRYLEPCWLKVPSVPEAGRLSDGLVEKCSKVLSIVYDQIRDGYGVSMESVRKTTHFPCSVSWALQLMGLVENNGYNGKPVWCWIGGDPDLETARDLARLATSRREWYYRRVLQMDEDGESHPNTPMFSDSPELANRIDRLSAQLDRLLVGAK